jgi:hypothetical protein
MSEKKKEDPCKTDIDSDECQAKLQKIRDLEKTPAHKNFEDQKRTLIFTIIIFILLVIFGGGYLISKKNYTPIQIFNKDAIDLLKRYSGDLRNNATPGIVLYLIVTVLVYIMLVAAVIIIIVAAYDIKKSYQIGANLEKHCNNVFLEKERPDFHVYACYIDKYEYTKKIGVFSNNNGSVKIRLKNAYELLLSTIITIILIVCMIITSISCVKKLREEPRVVPQLVLLGGCLLTQLTLFVLWVKGNYNVGKKQTRLILNPYTDILYTYDVNKYWGKTDAIDKIVFNHRLYIGFILITIIISLSIINAIDIKDYKIPDAFVWRIGIMLAILFIIIPLFIKSAQAFQINIMGTYDDAIEYLNGLLEKYQSENNETWNRIKTEILNNIYADERSKSGNNTTISMQDFDSYKSKWYQYLTHIVNKNNIVGIPIPQQLKQLIKPEYLAGERSIELKETLISTYNKYIDDAKKRLITKETLDNIHSHLKPYLKSDIRIKISEGNGKKELELMNNYILLSDNFKKGNPFPPDIIMQLEKMRKDNTIKKTVDQYFSKIRTITSIILIFIAYYLYHNIYPNSVNVKIQYVSIFMFVLMLILGIVGWWMKEIWL